ncbi:hypothetical protein B0H63DRAFT_28185 [Podospora didyma]|uniref:RNase H type-1 domain-containing protein n=1 Tax=Podospora didyma TaxID=330526 RepID=A0AAE0P5L6_9PEZI|nr:hypothetical protein B0H63DRAFT_28185 [Podospora didyma]
MMARIRPIQPELSKLNKPFGFRSFYPDNISDADTQVTDHAGYVRMAGSTDDIDYYWDTLIIAVSGISSPKSAPEGGGIQGYRASYGIWVGETGTPAGDDWNCVGRLHSAITNNAWPITRRAELVATVRGVLTAQNIAHQFRPRAVVIKTDSKYVATRFLGELYPWRKNKWKYPDGNVVMYSDLWRTLDREVADLKSRGIYVDFYLVSTESNLNALHLARCAMNNLPRSTGAP